MALARVKTWSAGEVLTASDLNAEFNNMLNNATSLISPATAALDMNGFEFILDADADTSITADTDDRIDFKIGGSDLFAMSTVGLVGPLTNTITAGSTQTQAGATALTTQTNRVTVSGTDGDGVKLPTAVAGQKILIINDDAAQTIKIWPNTSDAIGGGSADAVDANVLGPGLSREYVAVDATNWYSASALISQFAATLLDDATSAAMLTTIGVTAAAQTVLDDATVAAMATTLGLGTGDTPDFTGITFGGTGSTLANYAIGTWTPAVFATGTAGTPSYNAQSGDYIRVGNLVYAMCYLDLNGWAGSPTGDFRLTGLPFTSKSGVNPVGVGAIGYMDNFNTTGLWVAPAAISGTTYMQFREFFDNSVNTTVQASVFGGNFILQISIVYAI